LLTPGEIMQLPATDALVLVSGLPPIRAKKARYFEDRRLRARILPPPGASTRQVAPGRSAPGDDWTALAPPAAPAATTRGPVGTAEDPDGGVRRAPDLPALEAIAPEAAPPARGEFEDLDAELAESDDDALRARQLRGRFRSVARQAALDPDDGLAL
jgi:type IV secretion system protein VirD4